MISYIIWDFDPRIFEGFEFFRWYGLCWALGMMVGYQVTLSIFKAEGTSIAEIDKLSLYAILGAIIGARLGHILFYDPSYYFSNPLEILPIRIHPTFKFTGLAGLASHGGIIGALIAIYVYHRKFKRGFFWILDRLMIGGTLLGFFIRIGNLANSEIIGIPTKLPWAFIFPRVDQTPRHPTQLYEALFYLGMALMLFLIWRSQKVAKKTGLPFGFGIFLLFSQRFIIEFLKENQVEFEDQLKLNMGQMLSIPLILVGVFIIVRSIKKSATEK